jgi:N-acetylglucosaminyl-diphospho-decaprenol L-rhamnosyltransferase
VTYSIVVVTWESAGHLGRLVSSMNHHLAGEPELVVIDNASGDDPETESVAWRGPRRFVRLDRNAGFGAAANAGVELSSREAVVLLNPDTELLDDSLGELARLALERGALAGPRLLEADRSVQPSASGPAGGVSQWLGALLPGALQPPPLRARTEPWRLERTTRVSWLSGACLAGPREVLLELGPFDPAIHLYAEDMDLGLRAGAAGVPSFFCPGICRLVHHGRGSTSRRWPQGPAREMELNRRAVLRRAYGPRRERSAWLAHRLNLRLRVTAKRALGRDAGWEAALLSAARQARAVRSLPEMTDPDPRVPGGAPGRAGQGRRT